MRIPRCKEDPMNSRVIAQLSNAACGPTSPPGRIRCRFRGEIHSAKPARIKWDSVVRLVFTTECLSLMKRGTFTLSVVRLALSIGFGANLPDWRGTASFKHLDIS